MRLATTNRRAKKIRVFKDIFSNPLNSNENLYNIISTFILLAILFLEKLQQANSVYQTNQ